MKKQTISRVMLCLALAMSTQTFARDLCDKYDCEAFADKTIAQDSKRWFFNRYDYRSAKIVNVWESPSKQKAKIKVNYTYNNGRSGWAELSFYDGEFSCIRYWDFPDTCRPVF